MIHRGGWDATPAGVASVAALEPRIDEEIAATQELTLSASHARYLVVQAIRDDVLPASRLPKVLESMGGTEA